MSNFSSTVFATCTIKSLGASLSQMVRTLKAACSSPGYAIFHKGCPKMEHCKIVSEYNIKRNLYFLANKANADTGKNKSLGSPKFTMSNNHTNSGCLNLKGNYYCSQVMIWRIKQGMEYSSVIKKS